MAHRLGQVAGVFLKLGTIGFGGPASHIAMMEQECVARRKWLDRQAYLDLVGATNLIPGPNSTEMAMHVGYVRAGLMGLVVAGACFILPAVAITSVIAWLYTLYGGLPQVQSLLFGVKPAVLAIIATAGWRLAAKAIRSWQLGVIAGGAAVMVLVGINPVYSLLATGLVGFFWLWADANGSAARAAPLLPAALAEPLPRAAGAAAAVAAGVGSTAAATAAAVAAPTLWQLALFFLKVGSVLYGTGYVLVAYLEGELVHARGWLTQNELLDAIAAGQFTPGPILTTATFIGFVIMGRTGGLWWGLGGGLAATLAIFLPSFVFVAILGPIVPRLRKRRASAAFLDAVNAASMGLLAAVALRLAWETIAPSLDPLTIEWRSLAILAAATFAALYWRLSAVWLVLGGAALGWLLLQAP